MRGATLLVAGMLALCPALSQAQEHAAEPAAAEHAAAEHGTDEHAAGAAAGHAEEAGHDGHAAVPWYRHQDLWKFINLGLLVALVLYKVGGLVAPALAKRSKGIRGDLDQAREALQSAEQRYDDAELRLARLHDELEELRQDGKRLTEADKVRIVSDARAGAEEIGQRTRKQIGLETQNAKRELRHYVAALVVQKVRQDLQSRVERDGDGPFVRTILEKVEALPGTPR
jgi:F0F1-type ATP synthase membrane subunit b/b'